MPRIERVKALVSPSTPEVPAMPAYEVDLSDYDDLLGSREEVVR